MSVNQQDDDVKLQSVTLDAFLGGDLQVLQPRKGFRAGVDSVLLGAAVHKTSKRLLELGAGVGVASMTALRHNPELSAHLAEISDEAIELCHQNTVSNELGDRTQISQVDILASGPQRAQAGMTPDHFDTVIANPPYFDDKSVSMPKNQYGAQAHAHAKDCLDKWVKAAVSAAHATAEVIFVHRAEAINDLLRAYDKRLGDITILPIMSRPDQPASRVLMRGRKGSKAPTTLLSPLHLHGVKGRESSPHVERILQGHDCLDW